MISNEIEKDYGEYQADFLSFSYCDEDYSKVKIEIIIRNNLNGELYDFYKSPNS